MKITIYELIGLVKEGKQPNKIKYKGQEYTFFKDDEITDYFFKCDDEINGWLSTHISNEYISDMFTNTVEIIEEDKKIEKLEKTELTSFNDTNEMHLISELTDKINELIEEINKLKEK